VYIIAFLFFFKKHPICILTQQQSIVNAGLSFTRVPVKKQTGALMLKKQAGAKPQKGIVYGSEAARFYERLTLSLIRNAL
jgi:hypothetical protein